ncbi:3-dehydroquinate synthase [Sulfurospirillum deleyianum]|uniref:3-dehydroquinate synthase n=1 Tax=Sulfurospirillum deleyianum (strain ATCC 51133 / DSM 6946 / 5175) TaxID=525898 RepID=D1B2G6_SULD5|nr:3-dehydroquinate synthase [Sulfurospirillum deleyianum]ACZ12286.1 3-dehydroquinate synthase [Sulfurospirillum deleyianum DSM 6946]
MYVDVILNQPASRDYRVYIDQLETLHFDTKVLIVTNTTVASLHLETLQKKIEAKELYSVILPDGEQYKNMQSLNLILNACFEHRLDRKSLLIAFGGGVIGDMTGFAASIYQRGIDFIQIPTTLLSQVDASVGGKTGINNSYGKNLIGSFWQPRAVYCESVFLKTLPKREFSAGVAEMIKMAVTFDKAFFEWLETHDLEDEAHLKEAIAKSIAIKARVVALDETEQGIRAVLNYGHTFAHVIENQTHYTTFLHGEAVAIGMVMANILAQKLTFLNADEALRIVTLLEHYDLPTHYRIENVEAFYDAFFLDKKSEHAVIKFILAQGIGGYEISRNIPKEVVLEALKEANA